jgi:hypothetical protein
MGVVVVGDLIGTGSAQEQAIVGETPNLAARLQAARRAKYGGDCREHAPADRQPVRSVRSRAAITQGLRRAAAGLACVGGEPRARPVRGAPLRRYPRRSIRRHQRGGRSGCVPVSAFSVSCVVAAASAVPGSGSEDCGSATALACSSPCSSSLMRCGHFLFCSLVLVRVVIVAAATYDEVGSRGRRCLRDSIPRRCCSRAVGMGILLILARPHDASRKARADLVRCRSEVPDMPAIMLVSRLPWMTARGKVSPGGRVGLARRSVDLERSSAISNGGASAMSLPIAKQFKNAPMWSCRQRMDAGLSSMHTSPCALRTCIPTLRIDMKPNRTLRLSCGFNSQLSTRVSISRAPL